MMSIKRDNNAKFTIDGFDATINYINDGLWGEPQWFGLPIKEIKDMSLYEFSKYVENPRYPEEEDEEFIMDDWEDMDEDDLEDFDNGNNP